MIMCVLLCYPVSIRIYYQQGGLFLVIRCFLLCLHKNAQTHTKKNLLQYFFGGGWGGGGGNFGIFLLK